MGEIKKYNFNFSNIRKYIIVIYIYNEHEFSKLYNIKELFIIWIVFNFLLTYKIKI